MAQVLIRDLPDWTVRSLRERARRHGRSLEGELRVIVTEAALPTREEVFAELDRVRALTPPRPDARDSTAMLREDRDRDET